MIFGGGVGRWLTKLKVGGGLGSEWDFNSVNTGTQNDLGTQSDCEINLVQMVFYSFLVLWGGVYFLFF